MLPWQKIKSEYIMGDDDVTFASLARKHKVRSGTIGKRAARKKWKELREEHRAELQQDRIEASKKFNLMTMEELIEGDIRRCDRIVAKGMADMSGVYPKGVDPKQGKTVSTSEMLTAMRDRRKLYEWIYGTDPIADTAHKFDFNVVGCDMSKILAKIKGHK